jgi:cellulose synthase/poly-beta-1,6-N-acetylglucosamine synthase-like glycosyltransferase
MITDILSLITLFSIIIYFLLGLLIHFGLSKKYRQTIHIPKTTILVAARNEDKHLGACLDSLAKQDYPIDFLQIVVVNDRSTDQTRKIILDYRDRISFLELVDVSNNQNELKGKMNALTQGMDHAVGEIILITDADCRVPDTWVSEMVSYFTEKVGLVGSLTMIDRPEENFRIFDDIQTLDWFFLQAIAAGTSGINLPVSVLGNNFGFKKSVYDKIGGFRRIGFSLTEDMALLNTIVKNTEYKIVYPLQRRSMIQSLPLYHFREFIQQRKRWLSGGLKAPLWGWVLMSTSFITHFLIVVNLVLLNFSIPVILGLVFLSGIDLSLIWRLILKSGTKNLVRYFILFEIFYFLYTLILAMGILLPGKIYWKGRSFKKTE